MATDLFFSQPVPQNPAAGIYKGKMVPSDSVHSTKIKTTRESNKAEGESFLSTLKRVSRNSNRTEKSLNSNRAKHPATKAPALEHQTDESPEPIVAQKEEMSTQALPQENVKAAEPDQMPIIRNFSDFIEALEEMGFYDSDGGSDGKNLLNTDLADGQDLASLKLLMARLQQNELVSSAELKQAFERLQQFIAGALKGNTPVENAGNGQSIDLASDSTRIFQWIKELVADPHHQSNDTGMAEGEGSRGAKPSEPTLSDARGMVEPVANSIDLTANSKAGDPVQSAENAGATSQAESRGAGEPANGAPEKLPSSAQLNEKPVEPTAAAKTDADPTRLKEETDVGREAKVAGRVETAHQMPAVQERTQPNNTETIPDNQPLKQSAPAGTKMEAGSLSNGLSQATAGEEPVSRLVQETSSFKHADVKVSSGINEETVGKVIKTEAGTNDPGLLNSQSQSVEKPVETASLPKEADSDRSGLKTQTLDQIVQKAAIHLKDGQHEARIDLKPDYLGHIRMQVISENHQVTVKILAEHGYVKDMIQNNAHQLKADLQQQGLHIDKLEVTVSRDSDESGHPKDRLAGMRTRQSVADNGKQGHAGRDLPQDKRSPRRATPGVNTVDYFA